MDFEQIGIVPVQRHIGRIGVDDCLVVRAIVEPCNRTQPRRNLVALANVPVLKFVNLPAPKAVKSILSFPEMKSVMVSNRPPRESATNE